MKDNKSIRKVLFVNQSNIALIVFSMFQNNINVLFAKQVNINGADLNVVINNLLPSAANFLGFNIKEVEIVFDDPNIQTKRFENVSFHDCINEQEISKEIYKIAKLNDIYVNEINYNSITYDDIEKKAITNFEIIGSKYTAYGTILKAVRKCNVTVLESTNIYTLLNNKKASSQIIIKMIDNDISVAKYSLGKLMNVENCDIQFNEIIQALGDRFNKTPDQIKQMIKLCNILDCDENTDTLVSLDFSLSYKVFNGIHANDFVQAYQQEVYYKLSSQYKLNDYSEVEVITNQSINKLINTKIANPYKLIGLESIDCDKLIALNKIDMNANKNSQFKFETSVSNKVHSLIA